MSEFENGPWDEEININVVVRVKAAPSEFHEEYGRTPLDLARQCAERASISRLENCDGWADMIGEAWVTDSWEGDYN